MLPGGSGAGSYPLSQGDRLAECREAPCVWSLSRLRPLHIALLSAAYWLGLAAAKLGSAILAAWWVSRLPPGHGAISAGLQDLMLHLTIAQDAKVLWSGSTSLVALVMWVAGPPLLLALTWRWSREVEAAGELGARFGEQRSRRGRAAAAAPADLVADGSPARSRSRRAWSIRGGATQTGPRRRAGGADDPPRPLTRISDRSSTGDGAAREPCERGRRSVVVAAPGDFSLCLTSRFHDAH